MKIGNRILSVLLCLAMLMSMFSTFAFAETEGSDSSVDIPMGNKDTLTGANPTTDVKVTVDANAIVVDGSVSAETTDYVLDWDGRIYPDMFVYGTNLFATLAEAQAAVKTGGTVLVKSLPASENGAAVTFTVAASFYTEAYNTLPYVVGTAFDGSDWTANEAYTESTVTLGNIKFILPDANVADGAAEAGKIALYGFSFNLSGSASVNFNEMTDNRADFVIQNSAVKVSGGSPVVSASTYANSKANSKGASILFKNFYMQGEAARLFTEYTVDFFTLDGWYLPENFGDTTYTMYLKTSGQAGKSLITITNSNFQNWKGWIHFQGANSKNWFCTKNDTQINEVKMDIDFRPIHITNNIFNNSSLFDGSTFQRVYSNSISKTVITGNRIINKGDVVPFLKNNHAKYGNYFTLEMYNNYIEGYTYSENFASAFQSAGSGIAAPYAIITNNFFSDNTENNIGTDYWIGCTGNAAKNVYATDWYLDSDMTLLNSAVAPYYITGVSADNGSASVYNLSDSRTIVYNMTSGNASALKFTFKTEGAKANWYSDLGCTQAVVASDIVAGTNATYYVKVTIDGEPHSLVYAVYVIKSDNMFSETFVGDDILSKDMLLVSNMQDNIVATYETGEPFEYKLPHDGKTYTFIKGINAFSKIGDAISFAEGLEIETPSVYFDYSNEGESISIAHSVKIVAPNYNVKPFNDKGFSESDGVSDGTGSEAWTYNNDYERNKRTVAEFKFSGSLSPAVEVYGVELKSYLYSGTTYGGTNFDMLSRKTDDAPCNFVFKNILITDAVSGIFRFSKNAGVEDDTALVQNLYVRSSHSGGQLSLNSEYVPEEMTFDGVFIDYNALGNDHKNQTRWYIKQGNSDNKLTFKNCNFRNFINEENLMLTFMGHGENPKEDAGATQLTFDHNIFYNYQAGCQSDRMAFFGFEGNGSVYTKLTLTNNFISAPSGTSLSLMSVNKTDPSSTPLTINMYGNAIKGLKDFGISRYISTNSIVRQNYKTEVSSSDNTLPGEMIVLEGTNTTIVSTNHYLDFGMKLLSTAVEITDVDFTAGTLEVDKINNKYTGIIKEGVDASIADFTFTAPDGAELSWYEDSELTNPISEEDLSKIDSFYAPAYLKVNSPDTPDQYMLYTFDLRLVRTPDNLFTETFEDPEGLIDPEKAMIVSKSFRDYDDTSYVYTNFADETVYAFIKGENAFDTYTDALAYAEENGIDTPHILVLDYTGLNKTNNNPSAFSVSKPAYYFTKNYNVNPVISGSAVDGSDWEGNIGDEEGQFNPDNSVAVSILTIYASAESGDYKFYGFTIGTQIKDNTVRKKNINVEFVNTYFNRTTWNSANPSLFNFGTKQSSLAADLKENNESFKMTNTYFKCTTIAVQAKLIEGTVPATVIFDNFFMDVRNSLTAGLNAHEFNCLSTNRHFEFRNSCLVNFFFKGTTKMLKNTQTGEDITESETAKLIFDGCTLVNFSMSGKGIFSGDLDGLNYLQITNNKVYNAGKVGVIDVIASMNTTDSAKIPMKLVFTGNYINAGKGDTTLKRTLTEDSVVKDNYFVKTVIEDVSEVNYDGIQYSVKGGDTFTGDFYIDSELKYYGTTAIPATFEGDNTELTDNGAKYLLTEGDGVITDNGDGTYDIDVSDIVTNPAGNKIEISLNGNTVELGEVLTAELDDPETVVLTVIGYALSGSATVEQQLVISSKLARIISVTVGEEEADIYDEYIFVALPTDGSDEVIDVTTAYDDSEIEITDEYGDPADTVWVEAGYSAEYTITVTTENDSKEYYLTVERETEDRELLAAELEELIEEVNAVMEQEGSLWLPGAKDLLEYVRSYAYEAIDEGYSAEELTLTYEELTYALENAQATIGAEDMLREKIAELKAITNEDGKYCESGFAEFRSVLDLTESSIESVMFAEQVELIIELLDMMAEEIPTHTFTDYIHDAGSENCNSNGTMTAVCDTEGCTVKDTVAETEDYKNDKHNFTNYVYNGDAGVNVNGTETGTCSRCGEKDTRTAEGTMLGLVDSSKKFKDVPKDKWFKPYVDYVVSYDLMNGKGDDIFDPTATITRAEFVQVLANLEGIDTSNKKNDTKFKDLKDGAWYVPAVRWAAENGIVAGISSTAFAPTAPITREQMCVMLVEYAEFAGIELEAVKAKINFKDADKIGTWAKDAVELCQRAGIVEGDGVNFRSKDTASRAEIAVIISIFHKEYIK